MQIAYFDKEIETASREPRTRRQIERMQTRLGALIASNPFYREKLRAAGFSDARGFNSLADRARLPFTRKQERVDDQAAHPVYGTNLTYPLEQYVRLHQMSGTTGKPIRWLDTRDSWDWWARCWSAVYRAAGVGASDRVFFAFSFGPFIGFWVAFAGAEKIGALAISGGAQDSAARWQSLIELGATALCCTPSYALHLAEVARKENIPLRDGAVKKIIVAGEPGESIPATRARIEEAWGASARRCYAITPAIRLGLRVPVKIAPNGSLPRFELKARRVVVGGSKGQAPLKRHAPLGEARALFQFDFNSFVLTLSPTEPSQVRLRAPHRRLTSMPLPLAPLS